MAMLFSPGGLQRIEAWLKVRADYESADGEYLFDADHNAGKKGSTAGPDMPCLLTHGSVVYAPRAAE
eukprot:15321139-Alexandrium_andersonii.AAC.1